MAAEKWKWPTVVVNTEESTIETISIKNAQTKPCSLPKYLLPHRNPAIIEIDWDLPIVWPPEQLPKGMESTKQANDHTTKLFRESAADKPGSSGANGIIF